ncbi:MAG TPA: post-COAP-1 domain-containing protein [Gemmatimonadaceae bacterium]
MSTAIAATLLAVGCRDVVSPTLRSIHPNFSTSGASGEIQGTGSIGTGTATPGSSRQDFDFDVTSDLAGHLSFTDWSVVRSGTQVGQLTVSPSDQATFFTAMRDGSSACADATRGMEVDGTGRLDTGVLISFTLYACDNGASGSGADFFRFYMASANYDRNGNLSSGDLVKSGSVPTTTPSMQIGGTGSIGDGTQTVGSNRQDFDFSANGTPGGRLSYTDWAHGLTTTQGQYVTVDPTNDPATGVTSYQQTSATCVRFAGIGRVNGVSTYPFYLDACDNSNPGTGFDTFTFTVPDLDGQGSSYRVSGTLSSGDITMSGGSVATTGTLNVSTTTTGSSLDPDGYTLTVDGTTTASIADNGSQAFSNLSAGSHTVSISGVATNCTVSGGTSQTANVPAGGSVTVAFQVSCTQVVTTGTLNVTTATTGSNLDPDGYTVTVDGSNGQSIADNGSQSFANLASGSHTVTLSGVAANCTVSGGSSKSATVPAGGSTSVAFQVSCVETTGTLNVATSTTGANLDPDGYMIAVDGTNSTSIADNGSHSFTGLSSGNHTVTVSGVAANCTVSGGSSRTASVPAGGSVSVAFQVNCVAPPATQLAFTMQPSNATAGRAISPAVQVTARDASGNVASSYSGTITIALGANPGGGTLSGTTTASVVNGVATFSSLTLTKVGSGYTLTAAASGLSGATSASFSVSAGAASALVFTVQPSNTQTSTAISPAVKVTAFDAYGNTATSFNGSMTMSIGQNPSGGTLSGTKTVTAANGVGTFSTLQIDRAGNGYTLQVGAPGLTGAGSAQFNVKQKPLICILGICV